MTFHNGTATIRDHPYVTSACFGPFLGPPSYVSIDSTVNQQKTTLLWPHPLICCRNIWMVPYPLSICTWFLQFSSLMNWIFSLFQTRILQATAGRKIQFKLGKKIQFIKLDISNVENCKNQVQIDRGKAQLWPPDFLPLQFSHICLFCHIQTEYIPT